MVPTLSQPGGDSDWPSAARLDAEDHEQIPITTHRQRLARLIRLPSLPRIPFMPSFGLPTACAAMGALILALMIWRADVVRLLPPYVLQEQHVDLLREALCAL